MDEVKMFLFARWIAACYADSHLDSEMRCEHNDEFNESEAISLLNRKTGYWYKEQLKHFNDVVYHNYLENGTVDNTKQFLLINQEYEI